MLRLLTLAMVARHNRHARLLHQGLGGILQAHGAHRLGRGADEHQARRLDRLDEGRVLGEEAIARMDRLGAGGLGGGHDPVDPQVAVHGRRRADPERFVGQSCMPGVGIGIGIDRDRGDPQPAGGADHAAGDLAPIGDQDLLEHAGHIRNTPKRVSGIGALRAAERDKASTARDLRGSTIPSSQSRAEA